MVYKKGTYTKKNAYRGKGKYARKGATRGKIYGAAAGQLWRDVSKLKNLINVEFKKHDVVASINPGTAGVFQLLNGVPAGDDFNARDGRQVRIKSIQMNLRCLKNPSATNTVFRMLLVIDKQSNTAGPTAANILDLTTATAVDAHRNLDYRKRFVILKDVRFCVNADTPEKIVDFYKRLDMKEVFDGTAGTIGDISTNSIYLLLISDEATNTPAVLYNSRIRFIDN